jgi:hypothetical protein
MEKTEEYVNGQLKNKYGDTFIRGNNGMLTTDVGILIYNAIKILIIALWMQFYTPVHPSTPLQMVHEIVKELVSSVSALQFDWWWPNLVLYLTFFCSHYF